MKSVWNFSEKISSGTSALVKRNFFVLLNTLLWSLLGFLISVMICFLMGEGIMEHKQLVCIITGYFGCGAGFLGGIIFLMRLF